MHFLRFAELVDGLPPASPTPYAGLSSLTELSLAGCQLLTELGVRWLEGLSSLRRLNLETCNQISELSFLLGMRCALCYAGSTGGGLHEDVHWVIEGDLKASVGEDVGWVWLLWFSGWAYSSLTACRHQTSVSSVWGCKTGGGGTRGKLQWSKEGQGVFGWPFWLGGRARGESSRL